MTPRMQIVWDVLEAAHDNRDLMVICACRRLIVADRLGWKRHAKQADRDLVYDFADGCGMGTGGTVVQAQGMQMFIPSRMDRLVLG